MIEYRGCLITYPLIRFDSSRWTVNVASDDWHLQAKIGNGSVVIVDYDSLDGAVAKAKAYVDTLH